MTISSCTISGNSAGDLGGGGIHVWVGSVTIDSCTISGNTASDGHRKTGGGVLLWGGTVSIVNSQLNSNQAANGGGVYIGGATVAISSCTISGNSADYIGLGGGVHVSSGTVTITASSITGNTAPTGQDVYVSGGNVCSWPTTLTVGVSGTVSGTVPTCPAPPPSPSPSPPRLPYGDRHKQVRLAPRAWGPSLWAQEGMPWVAPCTSSRAHVWLCAFFMTAPLPH